MTLWTTTIARRIVRLEAASGTAVVCDAKSFAMGAKMPRNVQ